MKRIHGLVAMVSSVAVHGCFSPEAPQAGAETDAMSTGGSTEGTDTSATGDSTTGASNTGASGASSGETAGPTSDASGSSADDSGASTETGDSGTESEETCSTHILYGRDRVLWMVDVESGEEVQLTGSGLPKEDLPADVEFGWSPDGESVLFRRSIFGEPQRILSLSLDGEVSVIAESGPGLINPREPVYAESGQRLAFLVDTPNSVDALVVLANPDGTGTEFVGTAPAGVVLLGWSDVSFSSTLSNVVVLNQTTMHYVDLPSGNSLELVDTGGSDGELEGVDLTGSGQVVAYVQLGEGADPYEDSDILVLNTNGTGSANLTSSSPAGSYAPAWSPNGERIAFTRRVGTDEELFLMDADGANPENVSNSGGNDVFHSWAPDGRALSFVSNRSGANRLYALQISTGETTELSELEVTFPDFDLWRTQGVPKWRPCGE